MTAEPECTQRLCGDVRVFVSAGCISNKTTKPNLTFQETVHLYLEEENKIGPAVGSSLRQFLVEMIPDMILEEENCFFGHTVSSWFKNGINR
jgi:hypothetical protein